MSGKVDVFCSIAACVYGWGLVEYNITVCCDTIRDRDDIGWFVVNCIQQSQSNIGALHTVITDLKI